MSKQSREQSRTERAAAVRAAQERTERNRRIALIAAVVVVLGAIVAGGAWYTSGSGSSSGGAATAAKVTADPTAIVVGKASAPVKVTIYEDFLCPFCRELESQTRDYLRENAASGKVQVTYQPINLLQQYDYSVRALNAWAAVLKHGSPAAALKLHDLLYENQPYETASDGVSDADLAKLVGEAGADTPAVRAALKTRDTAFLTAAAKVMSEEHIQSTPTVFLNGMELTGSSVGDLVGQIENAVDNG